MTTELSTAEKIAFVNKEIRDTKASMRALIDSTNRPTKKQLARANALMQYLTAMRSKRDQLKAEVAGGRQ